MITGCGGIKPRVFAFDLRYEVVLSSVSKPANVCVWRLMIKRSARQHFGPTVIPNSKCAEGVHDEVGAWVRGERDITCE